MNQASNNPASRSNFRVHKKWTITSDIVGLELAPANGAAPPAMPAGAHIELVLPGTGGKPLIRHYSLCNAPHETDSYLVAVKREPASRGGSAYIHESLQEGHILEVSTPRDQFPLASDAGRHVLFAGGIGITPLLSMAQRLRAADSQFQLVYFARSLDHVAFAERLDRLGPAVQLRLGLSPQETEQAIAAALAEADLATHVYVCGPGQFITAVERQASAKLGAERFHCEYFAAAPVNTAMADAPFEVELYKSGKVLTVAANQTIVQALEAEGCTPEISCEQGVCGTCLTRVISGTPDHRDSYLSAAEKTAGNQMLICVSRCASSRLVLDL
ncbi:MAG: PDR/VanB family oxidoreductase [Pseudomonadota bacterium]